MNHIFTFKDQIKIKRIDLKKGCATIMFSRVARQSFHRMKIIDQQPNGELTLQYADVSRGRNLKFIVKNPEINEWIDYQRIVII